jgi:hypothetical protein
LDIDNILHNYLKITGILNNVFRPQKTLKKTRIKLYNTLALPVLLYGSETWTIKARDARRITAAEMKYMRRTAGYTWTDYKTNTQITKELKITPILDKLLEYKRIWMQDVNRMPRNRLPRVMKHYSPTGRRNHGRPLRDFWIRETGTGQQVAQLHDRYDDDDDDDDRKRELSTQFTYTLGFWIHCRLVAKLRISCLQRRLPVVFQRHKNTHDFY